MLPPTVPRLRIAGCAMYGIAILSSGPWRAISLDSSTVRWRVSAPIRSTPSSTVIPASSESPLMSISTAGADRRRFRVGIRL
jgi:hypothetical protein